MSVSLAKKVSLVKKSDVEMRGFDTLNLREFLRCAVVKANYNYYKREALSRSKFEARFAQSPIWN